MAAEIADLMQKAEDAGNEGEVDLSMELMSRVEMLKTKKAQLQANTGGARSEAVITEYSASQITLMQVLPDNPLSMTNVNQKLRVCDMCGAFLSIFDSDRRLADHFGGKMHLGYMQIRKKIEELKQTRAELSSGSSIAHNEKSSSNDAERSRRDSDSRRKSKSRSRSHSRERSRKSSRRDRSRSRDRRRRSRSRSRSRDRRRR